MPYNPNHHDRRSIRLKGYDYTSSDAYFLTLCTHQRQCLFGHIVDGVMHLNDCGQIVERGWLAIPTHNPHVVLDEFVVMPNHIHGIVIIGDDDGDGDDGRGEAFAPGSVGEDQKSLPQMLRPLRPQESPGSVGEDQKSLPQMLRPLRPQESPGSVGEDQKSLPQMLRPYGLLGSVGNDQKLLPQMLRPQESPGSASPLRPNGTQPGSIGAIVQTFKSHTTRKINRITQSKGKTLWQRNYYEHIVRNQESLQKIRSYIQMNPRSWASDQLHPTP
ncbi:transposase [Prochlorothrix hollandica]|uniref:transposase n=1 Tax=Prochlorothrix hollandica TaxID=1223 RepID=UPI000346F2F1|nr:transposase [Prochlorothrix hollandica]